MSTLIVASVIMGVLAFVICLFILAHQRQNRKTALLHLDRLNRLGAEGNLSFSSQEVLNDTVIGLDGVQRKLLIVRRRPGSGHESQLLSLDEVRKCSVVRVYGSIQAEKGKLFKMEQYLQRIFLQFQFFKDCPPVCIPFYDQVENSLYELSGLEQKARDWETILSKMLRKPAQKAS